MVSPPTARIKPRGRRPGAAKFTATGRQVASSRGECGVSAQEARLLALLAERGQVWGGAGQLAASKQRGCDPRPPDSAAFTSGLPRGFLPVTASLGGSPGLQEPRPASSSLGLRRAAVCREWIAAGGLGAVGEVPRRAARG